MSIAFLLLSLEILHFSSAQLAPSLTLADCFQYNDETPAASESTTKRCEQLRETRLRFDQLMLAEFSEDPTLAFPADTEGLAGYPGPIQAMAANPRQVVNTVLRRADDKDMVYPRGYQHQLQTSKVVASRGRFHKERWVIML